MKKFIWVGIVISHFCGASVSHALTSPKFVNLEGRLTDANGNPIITQTVVEFRIFWGGGPNTGDAGTLAYRETATIAPASDGTYQHKLGLGTPLDGTPLTEASFDTDQEIYLQLNIAGQPLLPRLRFGSLPFALQPQFPKDMIAMFKSSCPSGWSRFAALDGRFPRGADTGASGGATGGSATHNHGGLTGAGTMGNLAQTGGQLSHAYTNHTHTISPDSNIPPFVDVVYCQKN